MAGKPGMKGGGGKRQGAGRKKAEPVIVAPVPPDGEPESIAQIRAIMKDVKLDVKIRLDAAKALAPFEAQKKGDAGKKGDRVAAAKKAGGGKFAPAAPPKLVVNNK